MKYASFDIGRLNMAFVWMENDMVGGTRLDKIDGTPESTLKYLNELPLDTSYDLVLIERQMFPNSKCICIQHQMYMYCLMRAIPVVLVSSKLKTPAGLTYRQRKKYTVDKSVADNVPFPQGILKRDDIADAYCQLLAYLKISK